jgi:cytochrome bd ubiquinol oxidase subunit II
LYLPIRLAIPRKNQMAPELLVAAIMLMALVLYALLGGADFGGGVWDLLASGPRARAQRALIADAIAPIWEANHVWLIVVIVLLFTAFPPAFYAIMVALHVPLTLMLIGIVMRGAAFTFRHYDSHRDDVQRRWSRIFAVASTITPVTLGMSVGGIVSGKIVSDLKNVGVEYYFDSWLAPFPVVLGLLTLAIFSFLAAVYLAAETDDPDLQNDFRARALMSALAVFCFAWLAFFLSESGAPRIREGLLHSTWAVPFHLITGAVAAGVMWMLWIRRYLLARALAAIQVAMILLGWGMAQYPYIVVPALTISEAAAPYATLRLLLIALASGAVLLFPSFYYLYRIFKGRKAFAVQD